MAKRKVSNPLALAVLACLYEKPMHPYEMATTLRNRAKQESIKLNYGSLYSVVDALVKRGWIVPVETEREGRRPERTVYALTEAGNTEYRTWLSELLAVPVKEYTQFEAGLTFMPSLPPGEVVTLLRNRCELLQEEINQAERYGSAVSDVVVPRLFRVESEYSLMTRRSEVAWVSDLADAIENGSLLLDEEQEKMMLEYAGDIEQETLERMRAWAKSRQTSTNLGNHKEGGVDD